jgi:hypothetical protein
MLGEHEAEFAWGSCCHSFSETKAWEANGQRRKPKRALGKHSKWPLLNNLGGQRSTVTDFNGASTLPCARIPYVDGSLARPRRYASASLSGAKLVSGSPTRRGV